MTIDIQWDKRFEIGEFRIDQEHQVFLDLIKNVSIALDQQEPKDWCLRLLREIKKYAEFHFISEENIMFRAQYPDYDAHRAQHGDLLGVLDERIHAYLSDRTDLNSVLEFLFNWFAMHTTQADKRFAQFLHASR